MNEPDMPGRPAASTPPMQALPSLVLEAVACRRGDRLLFAGLDATLAAGELL